MRFFIKYFFYFNLYASQPLIKDSIMRQSADVFCKGKNIPSTTNPLRPVAWIAKPPRSAANEFCPSC